MLNKTEKIILLWLAIFMIIWTLSSFWVDYLMTAQERKYEAKLNIERQKSNKIINELAKESNTLSDVEILEERARKAWESADKILEVIEEAKLLIVKAEPEYEKKLLIKECNLHQINRKVTLEEYNLDYCLNQENLDQFRTKKY